MATRTKRLDALAVAAGVITVLAAADARADVIVSNLAAWDGGLGILPFSQPVVSLFGNVVIAPTNQLVSFSIPIEVSGGLTIEGFYALWDQADGYAIGPLTFSTSQTLSDTAGAYQLDTFTFNASLTSGAEYVTGVYALDGDNSDGIDGTIGLVASATDFELAYNNIGTDLGDATSTPWTQQPAPDIRSLAESADFSAPNNPVPEPASLAIFATAVFSLAGLKMVPFFSDLLILNSAVIRVLGLVLLGSFA